MRDAGYGVIVGFQMEEKIEQAYLYDLRRTAEREHQRRIYEDFVFMICLSERSRTRKVSADRAFTIW